MWYDVVGSICRIFLRTLPHESIQRWPRIRTKLKEHLHIATVQYTNTRSVQHMPRLIANQTRTQNSARSQIWSSHSRFRRSISFFLSHTIAHTHTLHSAMLFFSYIRTFHRLTHTVSFAYAAVYINLCVWCWISYLSETYSKILWIFRTSSSNGFRIKRIYNEQQRETIQYMREHKKYISILSYKTINV